MSKLNNILNNIIKTKKAEMREDQIPGGKADHKTPKDFNEKELKKGVKIEMEHTNDKKKAKEIAMDHLEEFKGKKYYEELVKMEKRLIRK